MKPPITAEQIAQAVGAEAGQELGEALNRIKHCLRQLSDEQVWWRPDETQNSIGNLILHLCGNVRQWIIAGLGGEPDVRKRPEEFSERRAIPQAELLAQLESVVTQSCRILAALTAPELLRKRRIQGFDVTALAAIFNTVPHFRGHAQEIICRTRLLLGSKYEFEWQPKTVEQGAPVA